MKYREEVMSKIFTYITVIVLLGIIAFEAYMLQVERSEISELTKQNKQTYKDLVTVREINYDLQVENAELEKFYSQWNSYAAFNESVDVERYKSDLFSRVSLIPEAAIKDWKVKKGDAMRAQLEAELEAALKEAEEADEDGDGSGSAAANADEDAESDEEREAAIAALEEEIEAMEDPEFTFENPDGENMFLPFGVTGENVGRCLIYTCAYLSGDEGTEHITLLYELPMNANLAAPLYDQNNEIVWNCIAYNIGDGWVGVRLETEGEEE